MPQSAVLAIMLTFVFLTLAPVFTTVAAQAQTFTVLHNFTRGEDGGWPYDSLVMDASGNLYGTTYLGGTGSGTVFKLSQTDSGWTFSTLYGFRGNPDAALPMAGVTIGPHGVLYGTTVYGGGWAAAMAAAERFITSHLQRQHGKAHSTLGRMPCFIHLQGALTEP